MHEPAIRYARYHRVVRQGLQCPNFHRRPVTGDCFVQNGAPLIWRADLGQVVEGDCEIVVGHGPRLGVVFASPNFQCGTIGFHGSFQRPRFLGLILFYSRSAQD